MNSSPRATIARRFLTTLLSGDSCSPACIDNASQLGNVWLKRQGIAPLLYEAWRNGQAANVPDSLRTALEASYYAAVGDAELHQGELGHVLEVLERASIIPVIFKGAALAYTVYPDPACRPMGDIDLWVTVDEMPRAQAALERIGYGQSTKADRPLALMMQHQGEVQMHSLRSGGGLVELHWGVFAGEWLRRTALVDEAAVWARCVPISLAVHPVLALAPEDGIVQLAVHFAINHQCSEPWLRALVDVTLLARTQPIDWDIVVKRARTWRVATATWLVLKLAVELAGLTEAAAVVKQLSPSRVRQWLIGLFANAESLIDMRDLSRRRLRFLYLLLLVDRKRDMLRLIGRTLWPESEWLTARYGIHATTGGRAGIKMKILHLFNVVRGKI